MMVLRRMEQRSVTDSTSLFLTGFIDVEIDEQRLAADVLCRLTEVWTMAIIHRLDDYPGPVTIIDQITLCSRRCRCSKNNFSRYLI
jgi:hypothetical protein